MKYLIMHGSYGSPEENWFRWLEKALLEIGNEVVLEQFPVDDWNQVEKIGAAHIESFTPIQSLASWEAYFSIHIYPQIKGQERRR